MAASSATPSAAEARLARSGPAIQEPRQSSAPRYAVSNQDGAAQTVWLLSARVTRTDQK
jgi:hypothetical protein